MGARPSGLQYGEAPVAAAISSSVQAELCGVDLADSNGETRVSDVLDGFDGRILMPVFCDGNRLILSHSARWR
jgi:hypothetical protein